MTWLPRDPSDVGLDPDSYAEGEGPVKAASGLFVPGTPGGGASTFLDLTDTPSGYTDQAEKAVAVNSAGDALAFVNFPSGGSGGLSHARVGTSTPGASWEAMVNRRVYAKKITLAADGLLSAIEAYVRWSNNNVLTLSFALFADVAGDPTVLMSADQTRTTSLLLAQPSDVWGARWFSSPVGLWLPAGDYWIAVGKIQNTAGAELAYDSAGSDRYYTSGADWLADWGFYTPTTGTRDYSIRASVIT